MKKKIKRTKDEIVALVDKVKKLVASGENVTDACTEAGLDYSSYWRHVHGSSKKKKPKKTKIKAPMKIQELAVMSKSGKTLLIVTDDADLISNVIANL